MVSRLCQEDTKEPTIWQKKRWNAGYEVRGRARKRGQEKDEEKEEGGRG